MAIILDQHDFTSGNLSPAHTYWAYNGLDCCEPHVVADNLLARIADDPDAERCYAFERAIQAPAHCMMQRGILVDEDRRRAKLSEWLAQEARDIAALNVSIAPIWDRMVPRTGKCTDDKPHRWTNSVVVARKAILPYTDGGHEIPLEFLLDSHARCLKCGEARLVAEELNPYSHPQVRHLFYELLACKEQVNKKGEVSTDDECLDKIKRKYPEHWDKAEAVLVCRRTRKQIGLLNSKPDPDGRWRASFNVGATEVDRWSSSQSPFRTGTNFQNIADRSRGIFVADPGLMLFYADLSQAESRIVAYDAEDEAYIAAHEGNDTHTYVATLCWPDLPWPGWEGNGPCTCPWHSHMEPHPYTNKCLAESPTSFDPHHDYRLYSKKMQHGGNIGMTPVGVARELHVTQAISKTAMSALDTAFPRRKARQREIINEVQTTGAVRTFLGRRRQFFERLYDSSTHREALAQTQQSTIGWMLNMALWRVWNELDTSISLWEAPKPSQPNRVWLLAQVHDAILGEVREGDFDTLRRVRELMSIPIPIRGRTCKIPVSIQYGRSWQHSELQELPP